MSAICLTAAVPAGSLAPLVPVGAPLPPGLIAHQTPLPLCGLDWRVGDRLVHDDEEEAVFRLVGRTILPTLPDFSAPAATGLLCPLLQALRPLAAGSLRLRALRPTQNARRSWSLARITLSDKGAAGLREDASGPLLGRTVREVLSIHWEQGFLLPDEPLALRALVAELALGQGYDLILTSGGTGLSPRDTTPEAILPLFTRRLPGFEQAMMQAALAVTPSAILSRAVAGIVGQSLVVTLPGSSRAVAQNLAPLLPALDHALQKIHGDPSDCGAVA